MVSLIQSTQSTEKTQYAISSTTGGETAARGELMGMRFVRAMLLAMAMLFVSTACFAQVGVSITIAPPEIPVYDQPVCPGDGYIWTPGYWAWADDGSGYYWVPGTWVLAPEVGYLWTPPYWGWGDGGYVFYGGYWGLGVGFYGGINYGFGYFGRGYYGGRWDHDHFYYNTTINNINVTEIHNVYNERVTINNTSRVSFNGGRGGITERPTAQEEAFAHERHVPPVAAQVQHVQTARSNPELRASANHGAPPIAATPKPGAFGDRGAVPARGAAGAAGARPEETARPEGNATRPSTAVHPKDLPPIEHPAAPNTGNPKMDQKYQKQQSQLVAKQQQERDKLQKQQDQEHQKLAKQNADDARKQQVEQNHQQQTEQLQQRHTQQTQQLQQRQAAAPRPAAKPRG
jgi:hypothetical protein